MSVIFVDTETTGLDPHYHEVWEIALIEEDGTEHQWRIKPQTGHADAGALRVNRMYERLAAHQGEQRQFPESQRVPFWGRDSTEAIAWAIAALTSNKHLVGIVPDFDARFLSKFLERWGYVGAWHYQTVDAEAMAAGLLCLPPPWDSRDISKTLGIPEVPEEARHTAVGDARWARDLYFTVLGVVTKSGA